MTPLDRRSFLALSAMLPYAFTARAADSKIPVGLELYSVREALQKDPEGTVRAVGEMGYQCVEFYAPYFERTDAQTKDMRKLIDVPRVSFESMMRKRARASLAKLRYPK